MPLENAWIIRQKCALGLLVLVAVAYPISWRVDPYAFGFTVLGLVWFQIGLAAIGIVGRLVQRETRWLPNAVAWTVNILLAGCGAGALALLRSLSWA